MSASPPTELLRALADESDEGMAHVDVHGYVRWANEAFADALAIDLSRVIGRPFAELSPPGSAASIRAMFDAARLMGRVRAPWTYRRGDGSSVVVRQRVTSVGRLESGDFAIAFHHERSRPTPLPPEPTEIGEPSALSRAEQLATLGATLAAAASPAEVVSAAVRMGSEAVGAFGGAIALLDEEKTTFTLVAGPGITPEVAESWQRYPNAENLPAGCAVRTRLPCYSRTRAEYAARSPALAETAERLGIGADATLPLVVRRHAGAPDESTASEHAIGVISFIFHEAHDFTPEDDAFLRDVADLCAHAIERSRILEVERGARVSAEEEREELARLLDALPVMITVYDPALGRTRSGAIRFNRAFVETLGWTADDARGGDLMALCYPDPGVRALAAAHMERPGGSWLEIPTSTRDGRTLPVLWSNVRLSGDRQVGVGVDQSAERAREADRERLLRDLAYERERLAKVFEQAPLFMAVLRGPEHILERVNAAYLQYYGDRPRLGRPIAEALPELVAHGRIALLDQVLANGRPFVGSGLPMTLRHPDRDEVEERFVDMIYVPLTEGDGSRSGVVAIGNDATARVRAERELRAALDAADLERRRLEAVLSAIPVGVAVVGAPDGHGVYVNRALQDLTGGEAKIGALETFADDWTCYHVDAAGVRGATYGTDDWPVGRALRLGETVVDERVLLRRRDGELRMTSISAAPIRGAQGIIVGAVAIMQDVEDEHRARRALDEARRAAEDANRAKTQFLANMSHELRTPLNAIAGHTQLLEMELHGPVTSAQGEALARIQRAQRHLLGLINDVLNFAKLQSGSVEYDVHAMSVAEVFADVEAMVEPLLLSKRLRLAVEVPPNAPLVWGDREKLVQILLNLMSNAVKFTPSQRADDARAGIEVRLFVPEEHPYELYLRVKDRGVGIPRDRHDSIFDPFVQVRADLTRAHEGTGLGLAISRNLARGMGGNLRVRSAVGEGAAFTLVLRRVIAANGAPTDRRVDDDRRRGRERRQLADRRDER